MDRIEDLKETAPCGMLIHYTVDRETDFVTYNDINGRGRYRLCPIAPAVHGKESASRPRQTIWKSCLMFLTAR